METLGTKVIGQRPGSSGHGKQGILVDIYHTQDWKPAYKILCDDRRIRSYQSVVRVPDPGLFDDFKEKTC